MELLNRRTRGSTTTKYGGSGIASRKTEVEHRELELPQSMTVRELADEMRVSAIVVIKETLKNGIVANINQVIDYKTAVMVADALGFGVKERPRANVESAAIEMAKLRQFRDAGEGSLQPRSPVVTILGHVDHGKTSLLDAIRQSNVVGGEAGGITQHIGAYQVDVEDKKITFLDTPGHEAFTAMRARGAQVTDVAILVVAADDGVMPQTVEAINHAKAANVPVIVAINKIDREDANIERVKRQIGEHGLIIEDWGGDVICVPVSARTGQGISELLENILLLAEVMEFRADPHGRCMGVIVEGELDNTRGPMATVLVQSGTLRVSDVVIVGNTWGKIKAMFNDQGKHVRKADPSTPVEVLGLNAVPRPGDILLVVQDEKTAHSILQARQKQRDRDEASRAITLEELYSRIQSGQAKELNVVLKTDVQGSIDAIRVSLEKLTNEKVRVNVIHGAAGSITESDVMLALASHGIVVDFNSRVEPGARNLADTEGVELRHYTIIYELIEDVEKAMSGLLEPEYIDVIDGHAEVRQSFKVSKTGTVAGVAIQDGRATRNAMVRITRNGRVLHESKVASLKHFKDDVRELTVGFEGGVVVEGYEEFSPGDKMEFYHKELATKRSM
ncbi:MAG: translation initiation factor IF-2 [Dehalococcoidia bacterium]|nr:translation initiation factor IF-2 [Dehalococcoidia bacterium]